MKEIPILFSTPMVNAILQGRKTMTRRTNGLNTLNKNPDTYGFQPLLNIVPCEYTFALKEPNEYVFADPILRFNPPCNPGDLLWVRETYCQVMCDHAPDLLEGRRENRLTVFKTEVHEDWMIYAKEKYGYKWKPSINMPKDAARIWLLVNDVRIERLHDISLIDIQNEGLPSKFEESSPIEYFTNLWSKINGAESWNVNPWVWAIAFEVISTTGKPVLRQPINH